MYIRDGQGDRLDTPEGEWVTDASANHRASAMLPDDRVFSTVAADRDKILRAEQLPVTFGSNRPEGKLVYEGSTNHVIENVKTGEKWGQFTGASRGVRHAEAQFDTNEGRALSEEEKIFLVYSTRRVLEPHMVSSTWILTVCLLLLIAYMTWVWIVQQLLQTASLTTRIKKPCPTTGAVRTGFLIFSRLSRHKGVAGR